MSVDVFCDAHRRVPLDVADLMQRDVLEIGLLLRNGGAGEGCDGRVPPQCSAAEPLGEVGRVDGRADRGGEIKSSEFCQQSLANFSAD